MCEDERRLNAKALIYKNMQKINQIYEEIREKEDLLDNIGYLTDEERAEVERTVFQLRELYAAYYELTKW